MEKFLPKILLIIAILLAIYGIFVEPNKLEIANYKIQDKTLNGIKFVFVSDFHIKPHQRKRLEKIVTAINEQNPDIVLSAGDFVSGHTKKSTMSPGEIAEELGKIKAKYGFYVTLGNHDGWYGKEQVERTLEGANIKVLNNENAKLNIGGKKLHIAGVEDMMTGSPDLFEAIKDTRQPTILLTHSPDLFPKVPHSINLTLAGHTHGGQIRLPFLGPLTVPSKYGDKYSAGLIEEDDKKLIVTKGIGVSVLPIRINCPPEIVVIEFVK